LRAAEPLERGDEPAVELGRPAPPGLPLLRLLLLLLVVALALALRRGAPVRDGAAGGAQGGRAGGVDRRGREGQVRDRQRRGLLRRVVR